MNASDARGTDRPILAVVIGVVVFAFALAAPGFAAVITVTATGDAENVTLG